MQVRVTAVVKQVRPWKTDVTQALVTFESLEPFIGCGVSSAQLANKTHSNYECTLFVDKDEDDIIKHGSAIFDVSIQTYPKIMFREMGTENSELEKRVHDLEVEVKDLSRLVIKLLARDE